MPIIVRDTHNFSRDNHNRSHCVNSRCERISEIFFKNLNSPLICSRFCSSESQRFVSPNPNLKKCALFPNLSFENPREFQRTFIHEWQFSRTWLSSLQNTLPATFPKLSLVRRFLENAVVLAPLPSGLIGRSANIHSHSVFAGRYSLRDKSVDLQGIIVSLGFNALKP